jgi:hypothetical protein
MLDLRGKSTAELVEQVFAHPLREENGGEYWWWQDGQEEVEVDTGKAPGGGTPVTLPDLRRADHHAGTTRSTHRYLPPRPRWLAAPPLAPTRPQPMLEMGHSISRRAALARLAAYALGGVAALTAGARPAHASVIRRAPGFPHPNPRPGVTAARVLPVERLPDEEDVRSAYAFARKYPEIFDGLYCACRCQSSFGHRSLLACYESDQPTGCHGCQSEGLLAGREMEKGADLRRVRAAVDEEYG